jgi:predicted PolB exonuclease-like 3'-5' exonuclease
LPSCRSCHVQWALTVSGPQWGFAPGLASRLYFNPLQRTRSILDVLSSFSSQGKATLHEMSRVMGLPGKPSGIHGGKVEKYYREGKIREIADYCESDVVNTYRVWLRYELFRGRLTDAAFQASEANLVEYIRSHADAKPHLGDLMR